jgi:hypothetical protein
MENRIGGIIVSVLVSSAIDRGFEPRLGKTKDYDKICILASPLSNKEQDWLARQNNVSEWSDMSTRGLLSQ